MEEKLTEYCILCGAEASSFGSRSVAEGWLCGGCVEKMSPWFRCRQDTTSEQLRAHLDYREKNRAFVADFHPNARLWKNPALYLDDARQWFAVSDAAIKDFPAENPDILEYGQILQCDTEIEEHRTEIKRLAPGLGRISYRPKRYNYRFHIWLRILVRHPFFDEMRFCLNQRPLIVKAYDVAASTQGKIIKNQEYQTHVRMAKEMRNVILKARETALANLETETANPAP